MKRLLNILLVILTVSCANGCSGAKGFKVTSCSVASVSPNGLKGVKAVLNVGVVNPMTNLTISDIKGTIMKGTEEFATFEAGKMVVPKKSAGVYPLDCLGAISKGVSIGDLLSLALSKNFSDMTINMSMKARLRCGLRKTIRFKNIKVTDLMDPEVAAAYTDLIINVTMI